MGLGNKGVFLNAERRQIITIKYGSDQVVSDQGINTQLMDSTAYQLRQLRQHDIGALLVTSGAVKYGHQLARSQEIGYELTRQEEPS